jgi:hypothetical protein
MVMSPPPENIEVGRLSPCKKPRETPERYPLPVVVEPWCPEKLTVP